MAYSEESEIGTYPFDKIVIISDAIFTIIIRYGIAVYLRPVFEKEELKVLHTELCDKKESRGQELKIKRDEIEAKKVRKYYLKEYQLNFRFPWLPVIFWK